MLKNMNESYINSKPHRDVHRCSWCGDDSLLIDYHDNEWAKPVTNDYLLFEYLTLEIFQAGLSWRTILGKRENFRYAFSKFDIKEVANYTEDDIKRLLNDEGIVRNRRKIEATIFNAKVCDRIIDANGSLYNFFSNLPEDKDRQTKIMKETFKHVGGKITESFLIAAGFVLAPHEVNCFLSQENQTDCR